MRSRQPEEDTSSRKKMALEVLGQFRIVFSSVRQHYAQVQSQTGLGGVQLWALFFIGEHPGSNVGDIASELAIRPSTASNLVKDLENLGAIAKRRDKLDKRSVRLHITPKGRRILSRAPRPIIGVLQRALQQLPISELGALRKHLKQVIRFSTPVDRKAKNTPLSEL